MPILEDVLHELTGAKVFPKDDLSSGYYHACLDEPSSLLTALQTPFGRFKWLCLPFGLSASAKIFQKKLVESLEEIQGVICIADGVIIYGKDQETHDKNLKAFLQRCRERGIKLNKSKINLKPS